MSGSLGLGEIFVIFLNIILLCIPVLVIWLLFKTLRRISRRSEQIENELKGLREEIQSLREELPDRSRK
jgi:uncharacterized protein YoxC